MRFPLVLLATVAVAQAAGSIDWWPCMLFTTPRTVSSVTQAEAALSDQDLAALADARDALGPHNRKPRLGLRATEHTPGQGISVGKLCVDTVAEICTRL